MRICLVDAERIAEPYGALPFGEAENRRLAAIGHGPRAKESRAALLALQALLGEDPPPIRRAEGEKPCLDGPNAPDFSLSHGGGLAAALLGDGRSGRVGVDLERIRPHPQGSRIAERFFHGDELACFRAMGESEEAFFLLWTRKEALAKMTGAGLARSLGRESPAACVRSFRIRYEGRRYALAVCGENDAALSQWILPKGMVQEEINETRM